MIKDIKNKFKDPHLYASFKLLLTDYTKWRINMPRSVQNNGLASDMFDILYNSSVLAKKSYDNIDYSIKIQYTEQIRNNIYDIKIYADLLCTIKAISKGQCGEVYKQLGNIEAQLDKWEKFLYNHTTVEPLE